MTKKGGKTGRGHGASWNSGWREARGSVVTAEAQGSGLKSRQVRLLGGRVGMGCGPLPAMGKSVEPRVVVQEGLGTGQHSCTAHMVPAFLQVSPGQTRAGDLDHEDHCVYLTITWEVKTGPAT